MSWKFLTPRHDAGSKHLIPASALWLTSLTAFAASPPSPPSPLPRTTEARPVPATVVPAVPHPTASPAVFGGRPQAVTSDMLPPRHVFSDGTVTAIAADNDVCQLPDATCSVPSPEIIRLSHHARLLASTAAPVRAIDDGSHVADWLTAWQRATATFSVVPERDLLWIRRMNEAEFSAHAVEAAVDLLGQIDSHRLRRRFDWQVTCQGADSTELVAAPRDVTDKLFTPEIRVTLSARQVTVQSVALRARDGQWLELQLPQTVIRQPQAIIQTVAAEHEVNDQVPPSPEILSVPKPADLPKVATETPASQRR